MAFPTVTGIEEFEFGTSNPITLATAPAAGELIVLCLMTRNGTGAHTATGYTAVANTTRMSTLYRINDGSEGTSIAVTWSETNNRVAYAVRIGGHHASQAPEGISAADPGGSVVSIAAPTVTPSWGSADTLWIPFAGAQGGNTGVTYPLPDNQDVHVEPGVSVTATMCSDGVATSSLSPGTWQFSPAWFRVEAVTVAVRPEEVLTAVLAATLPALTANIDATVSVPAVLDATLPAITADIDGAVEGVATLNATLPAFQADINATVDQTVAGPLVVTLPALTADLDGTVVLAAILNAILPTLTADLNGKEADRFFMTPFRDFLVPFADPRTPETMQQPMLSLKPEIPRPINLYLHVSDGLLHEEPDAPRLPGWDQTVFYGGVIYGPLTQAEIDLVTASGYAAYIDVDRDSLPRP